MRELSQKERVALINSLTRLGTALNAFAVKIAKDNRLVEASDIGNEIGIAMGKELRRLQEVFPGHGFERRDFVAGVTHGLLLEEADNQ